MPLSRRRFLVAGGVGAIALAGGGLGLVETGLLPGRSALHRAAGGCGADPGAPDRTPGPVVDGSFTSAARAGATVAWRVAYPPGPADAALPVCVALHGRGGDHESPVRDLAADRFLADAVASGVPPFVLASVDGGDASYWHRRDQGGDAGQMVSDELLPILAARGLRTDGVALLGWSMGGYGALLLAETLGAPRVRAVAAASPALWTTSGASAEGAFDDAADFDAHDVFRRRDALRGIPLRIDCGDLDPFLDATRTFVAGLPEPAVTSFGSGCHDGAYWKGLLPAQLRFVGEHLAAR